MAISAAQMVYEALAIAKCPGFLPQGGRALNLVLSDLVMHRNLKVNCVSAVIAVPAGSNGPFSLELNYLRTLDLFYLVDGEPFFLTPSNRVQFDSEPSKATMSNYPYEWASDLSMVTPSVPGQLWIYPQSSTNLSLTHRYMVRRPDITTPEASSVIPWFEDQDYLIQATALRIMRITDDSRYALFENECERLLETHLLTEGDEQQVVKEVQLDPRRFRSAGATRPTKTNPW